MSDIAIIGLAGRFPGAKNVDEFWKNLCEGKETTSFFTKDELRAAGVSEELINDPNYIRASPTLDQVEMFDAEFFGYSRREAEFMDPQQRILLETAWTTMENAGYSTQAYKGSIGMFAGAGGVVTSYLLHCLQSHPEIAGKTGNFQHLGNDKDFLATKVSYKLNLRGPSINIQSACSTSLVAVHMACQSVLSGECDMAMAGGISVRVPQKNGYIRNEGDIYSKDGHCRAFDADASGIVFGSGAGLVMVKRLEDAFADNDHIYAVIKGSAINNDGGVKMSYTASSATGQVRCMTEALTLSGIDPATIQYVEAHGTGTAMGDPVEVAALTQTFRKWTEISSYCALASVKSNLGHLDVAAGITSLIKVVLSLYNKKIPPTINFSTPNPKIDFAKTPFFVNQELKNWDFSSHPRRAAINGLGIGGTNAFFVLEEANMDAAKNKAINSEPQILVISAKTSEALSESLHNFSTFLGLNDNVCLADLSFTSTIGRDQFEKRMAFVSFNSQDLKMQIEKRIAGNHPEVLTNLSIAFTEVKNFTVSQAIKKLFKTMPLLQEKLKSNFLHFKSLLDSQFISSFESAEIKAFGTYESYIFQYSMAQVFMQLGCHFTAIHGDSDGLLFAGLIANILTPDELIKLSALPKTQFDTELIKKLSESKTIKLELNAGGPQTVALASVKSHDDFLSIIAASYEAGQDIVWELFHAGRSSSKRIPIPSYAFQRKRYWIEGLATVSKEKPSWPTMLKHPLLSSKIDLANQKTIYSGVIPKNYPEFLSQHVVYNTVVVPAAFYVDLALFCGANFFQSDKVTLQEIKFLAPLPLNLDSEYEIQVSVQKDETRTIFEIFSQQDKKWFKHCEGIAHSGTENELSSFKIKKLLDSKKDFQPMTFSQEHIYEAFKKLGLAYGKRYQGLKQGWISVDKKQLLVEINISEKEQGWCLNPMSLDSVFQSCLLPFISAKGVFDFQTALVPYHMNQISIQGKKASSFYCSIRSNENFNWDFDLFTEDARVIAAVRGYTGVMVTPEQLLGTRKQTRDSTNNLLYSERWEISATKNTSNYGNEEWLILGSKSSFTQSILNSLSLKCIYFTFIEVGSTQLSLDSDNLINQTGKKFSKIISLLSLDAKDITEDFKPEQIQESSALSYGRNLDLIKCLISTEIFEKTELILVTQNASHMDRKSEVFKSTQSGVFALAKTLQSERPNIKCRVVDLVGDLSVLVPNAAIYVDEFMHDNVERFVRCKESMWEVLRLETGLPKEKSLTARVLPNESTCLITGGLGGLGFRMAQTYAGRGVKSVVLVGRSAKPIELPSVIKEFAAKGTVLTYLQADVSKAEQVEKLFATIEQKNLPAVRIIIHAAGRLQDALLQNQSMEKFVDVFDSKAQGAWNLHSQSLKLAEPLSQFILFSSIAPLFGSHGQANYSAANIFLDRLAQYRKSNNLVATSIAWGPWSGVGMAAKLSNNEASNLVQSGFNFLNPDSAIEAYDQIIESGVSQAAVFDIDWKKFFQAREADKNNNYFKIFNNFDSKSSTIFEKTAIQPAGNHNVAVEKSNVREICEKTLRKVLSLEASTEIDSKKSFSNMGLDSLLSVEFISQIKNEVAKLVPGFSVSPTVIYNYPNILSLTDYLVGKIATFVATLTDSSQSVAEPVPMVAVVSANVFELDEKHEKKPEVALSAEQEESIAIVGIGCRFPGGSNDVDKYWEYLAQGVSAITEIPIERWDLKEHYSQDKEEPGKSYARTGGFLSGIDIKTFDAEFFEISESGAKGMDPQLRMLMEVTWAALENAGQAPSQLMESKAGIYVGSMLADYIEVVRNSQDADDLEMYNGSLASADTLAGRLAYYLGSFGPTVHVNTACSSSLVAIHLACQAIKSGECSIAIAGGVNALLSPTGYSWISKLGVLSESGQSYSFDKRADGYVRAEGCGIIILKKYSEAIKNRDQILGVIRGTTTGHGGRASSPTAPNGLAQEILINDTLRAAGIDAAAVGYLEAHATATLLGDPIEINAAAKVFSEGRKADEPLMLGSAKGNFGHMEGAAGVAGLIRAALSLKNKLIPPQANYKDLNPNIQLGDSNMIIPTKLTPFPQIRGRRIAGISSFGMSGIMAHALLEEPPSISLSLEKNSTNQLLLLSARNSAALKLQVTNYLEFLRKNPNVHIPSLCFTAAAGRDHYEHRLAVVGKTAEDYITRLSQWLESGEIERGTVFGKLTAAQMNREEPPSTAFLFSGQGSQYVGMARGLYETQPVFRNALNQCASILKNYLDKPLLNLIFDGNDETSPLHQTKYTQPALFALEYSLFEMWRSFGIQPQTVMGHSVGELVAACVAEVFSLDEGLMLICRRAELMQGVSGQGGMAAVLAAPKIVAEGLQRFGDKVSFAAVNGPTSVTITGYVNDLAEVLKYFEETNVSFKRLTVSHAFHSRQMDEILTTFAKSAEKVNFKTPKITLVSNLDGKVISDQVCRPQYWADHLRQAVMFAEGVLTLVNKKTQNFIEVGPGATLIGMASASLPENSTIQSFSTLRRGREDWVDLLAGIAGLFVQGFKLDWNSIFTGSGNYARISIPTYPFIRKPYWVEKKLESAVQNIPSPQVASVTLNEQGKKINFLGEKMQTSAQEIVFESLINLETHAFLNDHLVFEAAVVPGATYLDMSSAAALQVYGKGIHKVEDLIIHQPLVIKKNETRQLNTTVELSGNNESSWTIRSRSQVDENWVLHVSGRFAAFSYSASDVPNLKSILEETPREMTAKDHYSNFAKQGIPYGPAFKVVKQLRIGSEQILGEIELPAKLLQSQSQYLMHPALLDGCLQVGNGIITELIGFGGLPARLFLPFSFESWEFVQYSGGPVWCLATYHGERHLDQPIRMDLILYDVQGNLVAKVGGYSAVEAKPNSLFKKSANEMTLQNDVYELKWRSSVPTLINAQALPNEKWIVFADSSSVCEEMISAAEAVGNSVTCVYQKGVKVTSKKFYEIEVNDGNPYKKLFSQFEIDGLVLADVRKIVHFWGADQSTPLSLENQSQDLIKLQKNGFYSVLELAKVISEKKIALDQFILITSGAQAFDQNLKMDFITSSLIWGLERSLRVENPELNSKVVDLYPGSVPGNSLFAEITNCDLEQQILLQNDKRWVRRLARKTLPPSGKSLQLSAGTYLITGGLGGLGFVMAKTLVQKGARHIVLAGRSEPKPEIKMWIDQVNHNGVQVLIKKLDISDEIAAKKCFEELENEMPPVRGIFHAAGVSDMKKLESLDHESIQKVFQSKINGAWNLHKLSLGMNLDHFVMFSSAASFIPASGQGAYAAANNFIDSLIQVRRNQGHVGQTINWGIWAEAGMAAQNNDEATWAKGGLSGIPLSEGMQLLTQIMQSSDTQLTVMCINWNLFSKTLDEAAETTFFSEVLSPPAAIATEEVKVVVPKDQVAPNVLVAPASFTQLQAQLFKSAESDRKNILINYLKEQMSKLIANSDGKIDINEGLMSQGLDSLGSIELRNKLKKDLKTPFPPTLIFSYPSIESLATHILTQLKFEVQAPAVNIAATIRLEPIQVTKSNLIDLKKNPEHLEKKTSSTDPMAIAIVGVGCRYPGGVNSAESFWNVVSKGIDTLSDIPKSRFDIEKYYSADPTEKGKIYLKRGAFLNFEDLQKFDAKFFGISPAEAKVLDPAQRLLLETVWEAIENSGEIPKDLVGSKTAVFIGDMYQDYAEMISKSETSSADEMYSITGAGLSAVAGRISYIMGFEGPSVTIDTACSSSLVAIHLACDAIRNGSADGAIAGGVNIILTPTGYVGMSRTKAFSFSGRCATFDASADGYVRGEGCGVIYLKRLSDAIRDKNPILGVIRGTAVNQDGKSVTMTAPNGRAQERLIQAALAQANIDPKDVSYLEAHGTGTSLGDPIESQAFGNVLKQGRDSKNPLMIGSVKTNFGHTEAAAGIAGVIKVLVSLKNKMLPPTLHFKNLNSRINLAEIPAQVVTQLQPWNSNRKRIAGISSFGITGTNAHIIIEEAPELNILKPRLDSYKQNELALCFSAKNEKALINMAERYIKELDMDLTISQVEDLCYSAVTTRSVFSEKVAVVGSSKDELKQQLRIFIEARKSPKIFKSESRGVISNVILEFTASANFEDQYKLSQLCVKSEIQTILFAGHGRGIITAAYAAGLFSYDDGLKIFKAFPEVKLNSPEFQNQIEKYRLIFEEVSFKKPTASFLCLKSGKIQPMSELANKYFWFDLAYQTKKVNISLDYDKFLLVSMESSAAEVAAKLIIADVRMQKDVFFNPNLNRRCVSLPTYPFQREQHWITVSKEIEKVGEIYLKLIPAKEMMRSRSKEEIARIIKIQIRQVLGFETDKKIEENKDFLDLGLDSLTLVNLTSELKSIFSNTKIRHNLLFEMSSVQKLAEYLSISTLEDSKETAIKSVSELNSNPDVWIKIWDPKPLAVYRLFCFHYAGGSALMYKEFSQQLPPEIELCAIQLPGRWERSSEKMTSLESIVGPLAEVISNMSDKTFAFFGYSMGGAFAFETVRELRRRGHTLPSQLIVGACSPPQLHKGSAASSFGPMNDEAFMNRFKNIFGSIYGEKEMLESSMKDTWIGVLRNDMNALSSYEYVDEVPLNIPIIALGGESDHTLPLNRLKQWKAQTSVEFNFQIFSGGHLFIHETPSNQILNSMLQNIISGKAKKAI